MLRVASVIAVGLMMMGAAPGATAAEADAEDAHARIEALPVAIAAPELPWPHVTPLLPFTYVLVTDGAAGRQETEAALGAPTVVDVTGDGTPDVTATLSVTGPLSLRFTVDRMGTDAVSALVAAVVDGDTHPALPRGERFLTGFDARADVMPASVVIDLVATLPSGVTVTHQTTAPGSTIDVLLARLTAQAPATAAFTLTPVPARFRVGFDHQGGTTVVSLGAAGPGLPSAVPDAATMLPRALVLPGSSASYYDDAVAPYLESLSPAPVPRSQDIVAAARYPYVRSVLDTYRVYADASYATLTGAPAFTPPALLANVALGATTAAITLSHVPADVTVQASLGGTARVTYDATETLDGVGVFLRAGGLARDLALTDVPTSWNVTASASTASLDTSAPIGAVTYRESTGAFSALRGDHVLVGRDASRTALSLRLRDVAALTATYGGGAADLDVTHAGGPFRFLARTHGDVVDVRVTDLAPTVRIATTGGDSFAIEGSARIASLTAHVAAGATMFDATLTNVPSAFDVTLTSSPAGFEWHANGATDRAAFDARGDLGTFTRLDVVLDDMPADVTATVTPDGRAVVTAPAGIGRFTALATNGVYLPTPPNGFHYRDVGGDRALALSLPGFRTLDASVTSSQTALTLDTAGGFTLTGLVEAASDLDLTIAGMPSDLTVRYTQLSDGTRVAWDANSRATSLDATLTRGGKYTTIGFTNLPRSFDLDARASGETSVTYSASDRADKLELTTNEGSRNRLWARLQNPVPTSFSVDAGADPERDGYHFAASEHVTVDLNDDRGPGDYLLLENVRVRKLDATFKGSSTGWLRLDTDNHNFQGRVKTESGSSGFELNARGHLRAQNYTLDWWNYIPVGTSGSLSLNDVTVRTKTGGSWLTLNL